MSDQFIDELKQGITRCSSCGAAIRWVETAKTGKTMPLDAEQVEGGNINLDGSGRAWVVGKGKGHYVSHFSTCPNAKQHRKAKS